MSPWRPQAAALAACGEAAAGLDAAGESLFVGARLYGDEGGGRLGAEGRTGKMGEWVQDGAPKIAKLVYLRAAAPAADPGKEKLAMVSAGFIRVFCELSAWMLYIYIIYIYMHQIVYTCVLN